MGPQDRDYFVRRASQEHEAVLHSLGEARERHEELEALYRMRVRYIDKGLFGMTDDDAPVGLPVVPEVIPVR